MSWVQLGGSIVAIVLLAGVAWALGLGRSDPLDEASARTAAEDALTGFDAVSARVARNGDAALVTGADGSCIVVKRHGAHPAVRRVDAAQVRDDGDRLIVDTGDRWFGRVVIDD